MFRVVCIIVLLGLFEPEAKSQPIPEQSPQNTQQPASPEQRGTEQAPFIIKIAPTQQIPDKPKPAATERTEERESTWAGIFKEWGLSDKIAAIISLSYFFNFLRCWLRCWLFFETQDANRGPMFLWRREVRDW